MGAIALFGWTRGIGWASAATLALAIFVGLASFACPFGTGWSPAAYTKPPLVKGADDSCCVSQARLPGQRGSGDVQYFQNGKAADAGNLASWSEAEKAFLRVR